MSTLLQEAPTVASPAPTAPPPASGQLSQQGHSQASQAHRAKPPASHEFLTFRLNGEEYGIDILKVQEIRSYEPPTKIANAPSYIKGIVNLRGVIVPVVDLRIKFNATHDCSDIAIDSNTVVIILSVKGHVIGVVVDAVSDVIQLTDESVQPAPMMSSAIIDTTYIVGIAKMGDRMLILMDIEMLMGSEDMGLISSVTH